MNRDLPPDDAPDDMSDSPARAPLHVRLMSYATARIVSPESRHVIWLRDPDIAYLRIGKAANSSIRTLLAQSFDIRSPYGLQPSRNSFWLHQPRVSALTTSAFMLHPRARKTWSFSFVRHPVSRLFSCWNNKVIENSHLSPAFVRMGVESGMDFGAFVDRVAAVSDSDADLHVRSQASILTWRDKVVPHFVGRVEYVHSDWEVVRATVADRTGVNMGDLLKRNVRVGAGPEIADGIAQKTLDKIRERYAEDFRLFYPET